MKRIIVPLALIALIGVAWFLWHGSAGDGAAEAAVETEVAVHVGQITRTTLRAHVTAYGVVAPEPAGASPAASTEVAPSVAGVIVAVKAVEGQPVQKGDVLFQLDSRAADVAVDFAGKAVERERKLLAIEGTSQKALEAAEQQLDAARVQQALLRVQAPISGTITSVNVKAGEAVDLATVLAQIVDLKRLVVSAQVPSAELAALKVGQRAEVELDDAASGIDGRLAFVSPRVDARTGTAEVRVKLPGNANLRPGQLATVRIVSAQHEDVLAVPVDALVKDEQGATVISIVEGDMARQVQVTPGLRDGDLVEVSGEGLQAGMGVVTIGAYGLPAETKIRVIAD
jgi:membrane fusion protein (multidrug efflux system)